jgi:hypothetical protein
VTAAATDCGALIAELNRLFMRALLLAGEAGEAESASRIAAAGWSKLRHDYPREAERLNSAMHALARNLPTTTTGVDENGRIENS